MIMEMWKNLVDSAEQVKLIILIMHLADISWKRYQCNQTIQLFRISNVDIYTQEIVYTVSV